MKWESERGSTLEWNVLSVWLCAYYIVYMCVLIVLGTKLGIIREYVKCFLMLPPSRGPKQQPRKLAGEGTHATVERTPVGKICVSIVYDDAAHMTGH